MKRSSIVTTFSAITVSVVTVFAVTAMAVMTALAVTGCGGNSNNSGNSGSTDNSSSSANTGNTGNTGSNGGTNKFPIIEIPSVINQREQIIEYVANNYWAEFFNPKRVSALSSTQLKDSSAILGIDTATVAEALASYLTAILPQADLTTAGNSLKALVRRADTVGSYGDRRLLLKIMQLGEYIYYHPNSPYRNDELYLPIVEGMIAAKSLSATDKIQFEYQLKMLRLNRMGTKANDFQYEELTEQGTTKRGTLYKTEAPFVLLFFNNPGCESCDRVLTAITKGSILYNAIESGKVKVLSIYIDDDTDSWKSHKAQFPGRWIYARDPKLILRDNSIYGIRAIPSLYLLDKDKKVLLKDGGAESVPAIERCIEATCI